MYNIDQKRVKDTLNITRINQEWNLKARAMPFCACVLQPLLSRLHGVATARLLQLVVAGCRLLWDAMDVGRSRH